MVLADGHGRKGAEVFCVEAGTLQVLQTGGGG